MIQIVITNIGQQIIADVTQNSVVGVKNPGDFVLDNPRLIVYKNNESGDLIASFAEFCPISDDTSIIVNKDHVTTIMTPKPEVEAKFLEMINPQPQEIKLVTPEVVEAA
jgi:hypothetical protein